MFSPCLCVCLGMGCRLDFGKEGITATRRVSDVGGLRPGTVYCPPPQGDVLPLAYVVGQGLGASAETRLPDLSRYITCLLHWDRTLPSHLVPLPP